MDTAAEIHRATVKAADATPYARAQACDWLIRNGDPTDKTFALMARGTISAECMAHLRTADALHTPQEHVNGAQMMADEYAAAFRSLRALAGPVLGLALIGLLMVWSPVDWLAGRDWRADHMEVSR